MVTIVLIVPDPEFLRWGCQPQRVRQPIITGHNEVVAKVIFLEASVCPQGVVCLSACWDTTPPGADPS